jgi:hypothetical protein
LEPRAASGDAATRGLTQTPNIIAAEITPAHRAPQLLPTLAAARARLLEVIRQRPAPKVETDAQAEARWRRQGRLADVQRALRWVLLASGDRP